MGQMWKPQSREILLSWLTAIIEESSDELTEWELEFVSNIQLQLQFRDTLSERQEKVLEKIYAEKTK